MLRRRRRPVSGGRPGRGELGMLSVDIQSKGLKARYVERAVR